RARARPEGALRRRAVPHVDRARVVPRAPRLVRVVAGRRPGQQLARGVRRPRMVTRRGRWALVPAFLLPGAARPGLAQPRRARGLRRRAALLAGARRRWL